MEFASACRSMPWRPELGPCNLGTGSTANGLIKTPPSSQATLPAETTSPCPIPLSLPPPTGPEMAACWLNLSCGSGAGPMQQPVYAQQFLCWCAHALWHIHNTGRADTNGLHQSGGGGVGLLCEALNISIGQLSPKTSERFSVFLFLPTSLLK